MTAEQRAGLSDAALAMTQPCIDELIKDISRRVQKAGAITDTAEYQIYRAQALGEGKKAIEQAVSKQIGISEEVIASLFEYVADKSLSPDENGSLKRMTDGVLCTAVLPHRHATAIEFGNHLSFQPLHFCVQRPNSRFHLLLLLL